MGETLLRKVVQATGLPQDPVQKELEVFIEQHGISPQDLTLDELRDVMVEYLQSVFLELQQERKNVS
jgi:hypothetical protein